jgi:hypothetical protein
MTGIEAKTFKADSKGALLWCVTTARTITFDIVHHLVSGVRGEYFYFIGSITAKRTGLSHKAGGGMR